MGGGKKPQQAALPAAPPPAANDYMDPVALAARDHARWKALSAQGMKSTYLTSSRGIEGAGFDANGDIIPPPTPEAPGAQPAKEPVIVPPGVDPAEVPGTPEYDEQKKKDAAEARARRNPHVPQEDIGRDTIIGVKGGY